MQDCTFELLVNILTYAIKNKDYSFSQKDFKNIVYTKEFNNYDINEKIAEGFNYLLKRGLIQLNTTNATYYEKYKLTETIKINTENYTKVFKELSKRILYMYEGKDLLETNIEIEKGYIEIIECIEILNSNFFSMPDKDQLKKTLSKILLSIYKINNSNYNLFILLQLLSLKSSININIETNNHIFSATNIKLKYIQFNDETIDIFFDKCSFEIDDIKNITNIELTDFTSSDELINSSLIILKNYPKKSTEYIYNFLNKYL